MMTSKTKLCGVGLALSTGSMGLLGWVVYEPAGIVSILRLEARVNEAAVVMSTLAVVGVGIAVGATLAFRAGRRCTPEPLHR